MQPTVPAPLNISSEQPLQRANWERWLTAGIVLLGLCAVALLNPYALKLLGKVYVLWIVVLGLQLLIAHAGVVTLGQAAFVAVGAYVAGAFSLSGVHALWWMLPAVVLVSAVLGGAVGALVLRTQGLYQLRATLAVGQMVFYALQSLRFLGGDDGFALKQRPALGLGLDLDSDRALCAAIVLIAALAAWLLWRIRHSEMGFFMQAARDDERKLAALGTSPYVAKLWAFVVAAVLAGVGGALLAHLSRFTSPQLGHWLLSGELMVLVLLGGGRTRWGVFLACGALVGVQEVVAQYTDHWPLVLGVAVLLRVLWPQGREGKA